MALTLLSWALCIAGSPFSDSVAPAPSSPVQSITKRLTHSWSGGEPDAGCFPYACSEDGEVVVFNSAATNLVQSDLNGLWDVFIVRASTGQIERVSVASSGAEANGYSLHGAITSDGRFAYFSSAATNLDPRHPNGGSGVYRRDLALGLTELVSLDSANLLAVSAVLIDVSSDGRFVAMYTDAALDPVDSNGLLDVYVRDQVLSQYHLVSRATGGLAGNAHTNRASISGDGRYLAFESLASNLVLSDGNGVSDVFLHDCLLDVTTRINEGVGGLEANGTSEGAFISKDSSRVCFNSRATNLVAGVTPPGGMQSLVHDIAAGVNFYASLRSDGSFGWGENGISCISPDGRMVGFMSGVIGIAPGASGYSAAMRDCHSGITTIASVNDQGQAGLNQTGGYVRAFSQDNRFVVMCTDAPNLGGGSTSGTPQIYLHDRRSNGPDLQIAPLVAGQYAQFTVTGAAAGARLTIGASLIGQGLIATPYGLLHLAPPVVRISGQADALGNWSQSIMLPVFLAGRELWAQGVDFGSAYPTTLFRGTIQ